MTIRRLGAVASFFLFACVSSSLTATAADYGTFELPFSANSIWNTPIASGANREPANFPPFEAFSASSEGINRFSASDPLEKVYKKKKHNGEACAESNVDKTVVMAEIRLAHDFLWTHNMQDGGRSAFVMPDNAGKYIKGGRATDLRQGDVVELYGFERCAAGGSAAAFMVSSLPYRIDGDGHPQIGMHLGSHLSVLGGELREGELTSPRSTPIKHALKFAIPGQRKHYDPKFPDKSKLPEGRGYIWPAKTQDGNARENYRGSDPRIKIGRLYSVATSYDCDALRTVPAQKICDALKKYGAYDTDTNRDNLFRLRFQITNPSHRVAVEELKAKTGIDVKYIPHTSNCSAASLSASKKFGCDMQDMWENLRVVTNTSAHYAKGPGSTILSTPSNLSVQIK